MKHVFMVFLSLILMFEIAYSQNFSEDINVISAIRSYAGNKSSCFDRSLIGSDSDTYLIVRNFIHTKKEFKELISGLDSSMSGLSGCYSKIQAIRHNAAWDKALFEWAHAGGDNTGNCSGYKLSICKPIVLSSENQRLVIVTEYKYDRSNAQYDAFVYLYKVGMTNNEWKVLGVDNIYEIMDDWAR